MRPHVLLDANHASVRDYAAEHGLDTEEAIEAAMAETSRKFAEHGTGIFLPLAQ
jgi:phosphomethylpyrimidine synthase